MGNQRSGVHQLIIQQASSLLNPNNPAAGSILNDLANLVQSRYTEQQLVNNGVNPLELGQFLTPWVTNFCQLIAAEIQRTQQQQQPTSFGGFGQQVSAPMNTANIYGATVLPTVAPPVVEPPIQLVSPTKPKYPGHPDSEKILETLVNNTQLWDETTGNFDPPRSKAVSVDTYKTCRKGDIRLSYTKFNYKICENDSLSMYQRMSKLIAGEYFRGWWLHHVIGKQFLHIPMATETFLELSTRATESYKEERWSGIFREIERGTMADWNTLSRSLSHYFSSRLRTVIRKDGTGLRGINALSDITDLRHPTKTNKSNQHQNYTMRLDQALNRLFATLFNPENIITIDDPHIGDLINCDDISYYKDGFTKYDYGTFDDKGDRKVLLKEILGKNTVLRLPLEFMVTNALSGEDLSRLLDVDNPETLYPHDYEQILSVLARDVPQSEVLSELIWAPCIKNQPMRTFLLGYDLDDKLNITAHT